MPPTSLHPGIPEILEIEAFTLAGHPMRTSMAHDQSHTLWPRLMKNLQDRAVPIYAVALYDQPEHLLQLDPERIFMKWAAVRLEQAGGAPMEQLQVPAGRYARFTYKGPASGAATAYGFIYAQWLPNSGYGLDHRPHFACMPPGYRPDDLEAEEYLYIPIK